MKKMIDLGYRERKRDLGEPLIQGPANAHIHEDLELPLQVQRRLLSFPLRMPSSTLNTVRSLFPSFPPPLLISPFLSFHSTLFFHICTPPNPHRVFPLNWRVYPFYLLICFLARFLPLILSFLFSFSHGTCLFLSITLCVSCTVSVFGFGLFAV